VQNGQEIRIVVPGFTIETEYDNLYNWSEVNRASRYIKLVGSSKRAIKSSP